MNCRFRPAPSPERRTPSLYVSPVYLQAVSERESIEHVGVSCPACSPDTDTVHEVLKPGGQTTVRCTECGHVHQIRIESESTVTLDVVVSQEGESLSSTIERPADTTFSVDEEFILETDAGVFTARITSLETTNGGRVDTADAPDIRTIWTRAVGNVAVPVTIHPKAGTGDRQDTYSTKLHLPGDHAFVVGETETVGDTTITIEGIHLRSPQGPEDRTTLDHDGDQALAKDIKRVYARDESLDPWSPW